MPLNQAFRQRSQAKEQDRRRFQRVKVNLLGRFMLEDRLEYPCQTVDMSPGSLALITPIVGRMGERVVVYVDHIGRIEGEIARAFEGGFAAPVLDDLLLRVGRKAGAGLSRRHRRAQHQRFGDRRRYDFGDDAGKCFSYHVMLRSIQSTTCFDSRIPCPSRGYRTITASVPTSFNAT